MPQSLLIEKSPDEAVKSPWATETARVLHLINGEHFAGAERVQDLLAGRLPELGFEVAFAALKPGKFATMRQHREAPLFSMPMRSRLDARPVIEIARLLRKGRFSLLHTHTPRAAFIGRMAALLAGVPMVHHVHSPTIADTTHRLRSWFNATSERLTLRNVAAMITVSNSLSQYVCRRGVSASILQVVPNGVPVQGPLSDREPPGNEWTLGAVALFRPRKGLEILLDAMAELRSRGESVRLRAVGEFETTQYKSEIHARAQRLGLTDAIEWTGFTRNVPAELARMDLFVLPSLFGEGLPMVVLEAMAAGVPVVATRVEGVPEAIRHRVDGLIVAPGDAIDLAAGIHRIIHGQVNWSELRVRAHRRQAELFSDESMAAGVAEVYRRVLDGRGIRD